MLVSYFLYESGKTKESIAFSENRELREEISGVEQVVDLRAKQTEEILAEVKTIKRQIRERNRKRVFRNSAKINNFN